MEIERQKLIKKIVDNQKINKFKEKKGLLIIFYKINIFFFR